MAIRQSEFQRLVARDTETARRNESTQSRLKNVLDALKHALPKQVDSPDISLWFDNVEKILRLYGVEEDLWNKIVLPLLSSKAKAAIGRLPLSDLESYESVKSHLLREFRQTPLFFKMRFDNATKMADESHVVLAGRLRSMLDYYVRSRNVSSLSELMDLLVSDRLKACLSPDVLNHVLTAEGSKTLTSSEIASISDIYVASRPETKRSVNASTNNAAQYDNRSQPQQASGSAKTTTNSYQGQSNG